MPISEFRALAFVGFVSLLGCAPVLAFDGAEEATDPVRSSRLVPPGLVPSGVVPPAALAIQPAVPPISAVPMRPDPRTTVQPPFKTSREALRAGVRDYQAGDKVGAAKKLFYAAEQGDMLAQWKLGRMYALGDGVGHDDIKAFKYFSGIANSHADESRDSPNAGVVAKAFVALGSYWLEGIANTPIRPNPARAHELFHYAAAYFGDADAQYNLGRIYLDGSLGSKEPKQAARWFNLAAESGHVYAQAVLGQMLFNGDDGLPRQIPRGLMWLTMAREAADPAKDAWVVDLCDRALAQATEDERRMAAIFVKRQVSVDRRR